MKRWESRNKRLAAGTEKVVMMTSGHISPREALTYRAGLNKVYEPVISSHFMERLSRRSAFALYDNEQFTNRSILIDGRMVRQRLWPALIPAGKSSAKERAAAVVEAAPRHYRDYGLSSA